MDRRDPEPALFHGRLDGEFFARQFPKPKDGQQDQSRQYGFAKPWKPDGVAVEKSTQQRDENHPLQPSAQELDAVSEIVFRIDPYLIAVERGNRIRAKSRTTERCGTIAREEINHGQRCSAPREDHFTDNPPSVDRIRFRFLRNRRRIRIGVRVHVHREIAASAVSPIDRRLWKGNK